MNKKNTALKVMLSASCFLVGMNTATADGLVHATKNTSETAQTANPFDTKKFNVTWNILPTVLGYAAGGANYRVNQSTAVGLNAGISTRNRDDYSLYNIGVTYSYAINGDYMSTGWLVKPFLNYAYYKDKSFNDTSTGVSAGILFTYKWLWDSGINLQLGFGPQYASVNSGGWADDDGSKGMLLAGEFALGYAF